MTRLMRILKRIYWEFNTDEQFRQKEYRRGLRDYKETYWPEEK